MPCPVKILPLLACFLLASCGAEPPGPCGGDLSSRSDRFILVGDTQRTSLLEFWREQNDSERRAVAQRISEEAPAFLLILGDLVFQGDDAKHWQRFDELMAPIREKNLPCYAILGNHEYRGANADAMESFSSRFPHLRGRKWYSLRFRSVVILALDSNFGDLGSKEGAEQTKWYRAELESLEKDPAVKHVVVCCHHPPFTNSTVVSDDLKVQELFLEPLWASRKARLLVSGHAHAYERFRRNGKEFIVSGGGGGPRHPLETDPARRRHADQYKGGALREFHFLRFTVDGGGLHMEMVKLEPSSGEWRVGDELLVRS